MRGCEPTDSRGLRAAIASALCAGALVAPATGEAYQQTFATPGSYGWAIPAGVEMIRVAALGGGGGGGDGAAGGAGCLVTAIVPVPSGAALMPFTVGGGGGGSLAASGGGGGSTDVALGGGLMVIAGGGGGAGNAVGGIPNGGIGCAAGTSAGGGGTGEAPGGGGNGGADGAGGGGAVGAPAGESGYGGPGGAGNLGAGGAGGSGEASSGAGAEGAGGGGGGGGGYGGGGAGGGGLSNGGGGAGGSLAPIASPGTAAAVFAAGSNGGASRTTGGDGALTITALEPAGALSTAVNGTAATITWSTPTQPDGVGAVTYRLVVDGAARAGDGASPTRLTGLAVGSHSVYVAALTADGLKTVTALRTFAVKPPNALAVRARGVQEPYALVTHVTVGAAGIISQTGVIVRGRAAKRACTGSSMSLAAGALDTRCIFSKSLRRALARGGVRLRVTTTFTPTGGDPRTVRRTFALHRQHPSSAASGGGGG